MSKPLKVLVLDIETAPMKVFVWELRKIDNIGLDQVIVDRYVLSHGSMWFGQPDTFEYHDQFGEGEGKDKRILKILWKRLNEADVVITQNGQWFDSRRINARYLEHGIRPPAPYKHYDTYQLLRRVADFPSNKLEYYTNKLNKKYKKLSHKDFPGFSLWKAFIGGVRAARRSMREYNTHDVFSTDELAANTLAWAPESFPDFYQVSDRAMECGHCGLVDNMQEVKPKRTRSTQYHQYRCRGCGAYQSGKKITTRS